MEISQDELNTLYVLDLPCFKFRGQVTDKDEKRASPAELRKIFWVPAYTFARAIVDLALSLKENKNVRAEIREKLVIPETIFDCNPDPQAFTTIQGAGTIHVNLGLFFTISTMPHTIAWVQHLQQRESITIDELMNLVIPPEVLNEINRTMEKWDSFHRTGMGNLDAILSGIDPEPFGPERYEMISVACQQIFIFITFHEMAHWYQTVYLPDEWEKLTRKTKNYLISWLSESEDPFMSEARRQDISLLFKNHPEVLESWAGEIQADILAVENCLSYFPGNDRRRVRQQVYAAQAMAYSLLIGMMEVFYEFVVKEPSSWRTHPQASIRESIFRYIGAKELKYSQRDFTSKEWGAGTIITYIMARAMHVFVDEIASHF